jgi:hypothetical protein
MRQENGEMLPKQPQPQLLTPSPNASEGAEKTYCQRQGGGGAKDERTCEKKLSENPGPSASFRGRRANERATKMLIYCY